MNKSLQASTPTTSRYDRKPANVTSKPEYCLMNAETSQTPASSVRNQNTAKLGV